MQLHQNLTEMQDIAEERLVGAHFGVIEDLVPIRPEPDDVPLSVYAARLADTSALGSVPVPREASGAALTDAAARAACMGEAVERYAASLPSPGAVVQARAQDLSNVVLPDHFALFTAHQYRQSRHRFPFRPWSAEDRMGWVQGRSLCHDERVWIPAAFVFQPYAGAENEAPLTPSISTGLACGATLNAALTTGLCEVIERDAVALAWLGQVVPPRVELSRLPEESDASQLVRLLTEHGLRFIVLDLTTDLAVPVFAALVEGWSSVGHVISFGSACHRDPLRACGKALVEAAHGRMFVKSLIRRDLSWRAGRGFRNVTSFPDHARFYTTHPEHRSALDRWWQTRRTVELRSAAEASVTQEPWLKRQAERLCESGFNAIGVELTTPDIRVTGWHVARVVVPGLQPLHGHHRWPHLGGTRLKRVAEIFGTPTRPAGGFNRYPHPCP